MRLVDQVGGALATAHALGVAHGDVQASNILLNEADDFFLSDFGIATDNPAPGGALAQQVDVAAFAVMVNGAIPTGVFTEDEAALVAAAQGGGYSTASDWIEAWRREVGAAANSPTYTVARNPYKGLAAFNELDAVDFHGRAAVTSELIEAVGSHRMVAAVGPSGVGKSSVVRAGLLPALRGGAIPRSDQWLIADCVPGSHPFERLASSLIRVAASVPSNLEELLRSDSRGLIKAVERYLPTDSQLLIVIDQFEELFTLTADQGTQDRFLDLLTTSVEDPSTPVRILVTMRADFFDRPLRHGAFGELLRAGTVPVSAPTDSEMRDIITRPAAGVGVDFEAGLVERMVTEVHGEAGALPLVEFALTELFEQRDTNLLTLDAYEVSGGVTAALGRRAEEIYDALNDADREHRSPDLHASGDTGRGRSRHPPPAAQVGTSPSRTRFRGGRHDRGSLRPASAPHLRPRRGHRSSTVEVAHEALLREWPRLKAWIDANREELVMRSRLAIAVGDWEASNRSDAYLLSGGRLAQHETWSEGADLSLSTTEQDLLAESRRREDELEAIRKRRRQFIMTLDSPPPRSSESPSPGSRSPPAGALTTTLPRRRRTPPSQYSNGMLRRLRSSRRNSRLSSVGRPRSAATSQNFPCCSLWKPTAAHPARKRSRAVFNALGSSPITNRVLNLDPLADPCRSFALSPDGLDQFGFLDGRLVTRDLSTGAVADNGPAPYPCGKWFADSEAGRRVALNEDGTKLSLATSDGVWTIEREFAEPLIIRSRSFNEAARLVFQTSTDGVDTIVLLDSNTGELVGEPFRDGDELTKVGFSGDGSLLALGWAVHDGPDGDGRTSVIEIANGEEVFHIDSEFPPFSFAFDAATGQLLAGLDNGGILTIDSHYTTGRV